MLICLNEALCYVLCNKLTGIEDKRMRGQVSMFIKEVASQYSQEDLQVKFNTPEESIKRFTKYLKNWGELIESDDISIN